MADPTIITPAAAPATTAVPGASTRLSGLAVAAPLRPLDLVAVSQFDDAAGRWSSRKATFDQVARASRPPCRYVAADTLADPDDAGFYADPTAGPFTLTLPPIALMGFRELPVLNVGAGSFTLAAAPGERVVTPAGVAASLTLRPGETLRMRAVTVPAPARSGWYIVGC